MEACGGLLDLSIHQCKQLSNNMARYVTYQWPPDMAAPTETLIDLSIDQSKQSSTFGHCWGHHILACVPIRTIP